MSTPSILSRLRDDEPRDALDELSDADLEQVVGGLARTWHFDVLGPIAPPPALIAVATLPALETLHRISA